MEETFCIGPPTANVRGQIIHNPYTNLASGCENTSCIDTEGNETFTENEDHSLLAKKTQQGFKQATAMYNQFARVNGFATFNDLDSKFLGAENNFQDLAQNFAKYLLQMKKPNRQNYQPLSLLQSFSGWYSRLKKCRHLRSVTRDSNDLWYNDLYHN